MREISIIVPKKIEERLKEESEKSGSTGEELILKALSEYLREPLDPESKVELHLKLCEKYLKEAEEFLTKKNYVQASEKAWGAASQIVKAVALRRGKEIRSHGELHRFVLALRRETGDEDLRRLWQVATSLHQNFYENWLPGEIVEESIKDVKEFIEKLRGWYEGKEEIR